MCIRDRLGTDHMADHAGLRHAAADDAGQIEHFPGRKVNDGNVRHIDLLHREQDAELHLGELRRNQLQGLDHAGHGGRDEVSTVSCKGTQRFLISVSYTHLYAKLLTQLFGPRMYIANATGCSSI